ncbi:hypothetical protein HPP92_028712 [Vanilla planifolia]|uniref:DUF632 domain-containing protein n=1 Tax=Vanilla planifolia TaxID=51239 RepID=A0A835U5C6_VANPL|nr:hypothetical protein HPP92_028712 [Vanilla planifolia]
MYASEAAPKYQHRPSYISRLSSFQLELRSRLKLHEMPKKTSRQGKVIAVLTEKGHCPAIFVTCQDWLKLLEELPEKEVEDAINKLIEVAAQFLPRTERGDGGLRSTLSFSRKVNEEIQREEETVDWSLNYDSLQSCLAVFFDRLKSFAESSLAKYEALQRSINEARDRYDTTEIRK